MSSITLNNQLPLNGTQDISRIERSDDKKANLPASNHFVGTVEISKKKGVVSTEQANQALQNIVKDNGVSIGQLEKASINDIVMMATNLGLKALGDTANSAAKSLKIKTDAQEVARNRQVKEFQEQLAKQIEQSNKAHKGGIFGAIFDWIVGAVEAVIGAFKMLEGVARVAVGDVSGALDIASGAAYLTAGFAGMVKAAAETAILCGADKDKCQDVINVASKVQLGAEIVGMACDIFQAGRAISATRGIATGTETAMKEAAPKLIESIGKGSTKEIATVAENVGKQVSEQVGQQVMQQLMKEGAEQSGQISKALAKAFSEDAIRELVTKAVKETAEQAIKKGVTLTAEELTKQVSKNVSQEVFKAIFKACTYTSLEIVRATAGSSKAVTSGAIGIEKAKLQKQIEELILKQNFMEFCYEWYNKAKEQQTKSIKDLFDKQGDAVSGASNVISQTGSLQARIATSSI